MPVSRGRRALSAGNINGKFASTADMAFAFTTPPPSLARPMKKSHQGRPPMTDIAKLTGVSQSTVSLVLNNATGAKFSDTTRNKVLKAAQELGYRMTTREPSDAAITAHEKNLIVYLADEISTSPHPVVNID